jgi:indolepyruvate ferredoxin oxidoreductase beta subunit
MGHVRGDSGRRAAVCGHASSDAPGAARFAYDVYLVGVGGQGVLTVGDVLAEAAWRNGIAVNFYPTKGMAQRGGFVKAQLRLGRQVVGPQIPEKGADLVIAMELSEALKAVRFVKPGGDFLLFGHVWQPTAVMLGSAPYPTLEQVVEQVEKAGAKLLYLDPEQVPVHEGVLAPANVYVLGAALGHTPLGKALDPAAVGRLVKQRWKRAVGRNRLAFEAGREAVTDLPPEWIRFRGRVRR